MAPDERIRAAIHEKLAALIGTEEAAALMEMLPPERWTELATKADLRELRPDLRREICHLEQRTDLKFEALEHRLVRQAHELRTEMADFRTDMIERIAETRVALTEQLRDTYLKLVAVLVPSILIGVGLAFSAARLS